MRPGAGVFADGIHQTLGMSHQGVGVDLANLAGTAQGMQLCQISRVWNGGRSLWGGVLRSRDVDRCAHDNALVSPKQVFIELDVTGSPTNDIPRGHPTHVGKPEGDTGMGEARSNLGSQCL